MLFAFSIRIPESVGTMKKKLKTIALCAVLILLWLFPVIYGGRLSDTDFIKAAGSVLLFLAAAALSRLLPNRHAALIAALAIGAGSCALRPAAVFDTLPALLLCCWLRCYREQETGRAVRAYLEVLTDLVFACPVAAAVRLAGSGYRFARLEAADSETLPELALMAFVLLAFLVFFAVGWGNALPPAGAAKNKKKAKRGEGRKVVGLIPVYVSARTFWGLCAVLLAACLAQYTNARLIPEATLVFSTRYRLLFLPWMTLLFLSLDAFYPGTALGKRFSAE